MSQAQILDNLIAITEIV